MRLIFTLVFLLFMGLAATAQQRLPCVSPTPNEAQRQQLIQMLQHAEQGRGTSTQITYLPARLHIVRDDRGAGGASEATLLQALAETNHQLRGSGTQFYVAGPINYINSSRHHDLDYSNEPSLVTAHDDPNTLNLYCVRSITISGFGGAGGYAVGRRAVLTNGSLGDHNIVSHEMGHLLGLMHTFHDNQSADPARRERVDRTNCTTAGDLVSDTPADPYGRPGATIADGVYTGTVTDDHGARFSPAVRNCMSYWGCGNEFTLGQQQFAAAYRSLMLTDLSSNRPQPAAPTALQATNLDGAGIQLSWTDRAADELGYFVERSTDAGQTFAAVGFVVPNATRYLDASPPAGVEIRYRVKPANAPAGFSNVVSARSGRTYCRPQYVGDNCRDASAPPVYFDDFQLRAGSAVVLQRPSEAGCTSYADRTTLAAPVLTPGSTYNFNLRLHSAQGQYFMQYCGVWVDYNRDGDFDDSGEQVFRGTTSAFEQSGNFQVPAQLATGDTRLRVRTQAPGVGLVTDACAWAFNGATEDYTVRLGGAPLPVELVAFTAQATTDGRVQLQWRTAQEQNNDQFEIERSADSQRYVRVGSVRGAGTSSQPHNYNFTDLPNSVPNAQLYYRLRQVDTDGAVAHSQVRTVRVSPAGELALYPTATSDVATLDIRALPAGSYTVQAVDVLGRECASWELPGGQQHALQVAKLPAGTYMLSFSDKNQRLPALRLVRL